MKNLLLVLSALVIILNCQADHHITRGPAVGEFYFIGPTHTTLGLYRSTDFGSTIICMDSTIAYSIMGIAADKTTGYIYYVSYSESIFRSDSYGQANSWELVEGGGNINLSSGVTEGFLFNGIQKHTEDYGDTFIWHSINGFFGSLSCSEIDINENIGYAKIKQYSVPDSSYLLITYDKFENLQVLQTFNNNKVKIGWLSRGVEEGELFNFSSGFAFNEGFINYSTDYGFSWSKLNVINYNLDQLIYVYTGGGTGGRQDGECYMFIAYITDWWADAHIYILHSLDYGVTFDVKHHPFNGDEPLFSNFSAKAEGEEIDPEKYDSVYFVNGKAPLEVQFSNYSIGNVISYEWDFNNDGIIDSYEENPKHTYSDTGWHSVSLKVVDQFTTNTFLREDYIHTYVTTGMEEANPTYFSCFPNPFKKKLTISVSLAFADKIEFVEIYSITGELVRTIKSRNECEFIWYGESVKGYRCEPGIYFIKAGNNKYIKKVLLTQNQ